MRVLLTIAVSTLLCGCGATAPLVVLDVDSRLLERCSKTLPVLASGSDVENLEWSKSMLGLYAKCAKSHESLAIVIEAYNGKIDEAAKKLGTERSE